jgi:adenylate kinase
VNLLLMGPPGAGKGTQAVRLRDRLGILHVSAGDLLRDEVKRGTALGNLARDIMGRGGLVPDDLVARMIEERLAAADAGPGFVLDGFPRTLVQAEKLDEILDRIDRKLDRVLAIQVEEPELLRRLTGRRVCAGCGAGYHILSHPPRTDGVCDACGSELRQRPDDRDEVVRERLRVYWEQTRPLLDFYRERGLLADVDGDGSLEEVARRMSEALSAVRR